MNEPRKRPDRCSVYASAATLARFDAFARSRGLTRFAAVNGLIDAALDAAEGNQTCSSGSSSRP